MIPVALHDAAAPNVSPPRTILIVLAAIGAPPSVRTMAVAVGAALLAIVDKKTTGVAEVAKKPFG